MIEACDISVSFGGVRAVDQVSITVSDDEIVGLIGPNGSGKTTFLNALTGIVKGRGSLAVDGRALPLGRPAVIRRAGLVRTFQAPQTYLALSCIENVLLSSPNRKGTGVLSSWFDRRLLWRQEQVRWAKAEAALDRVGLGSMAEGPAALLTYGQQRMLELGRSLAAEPRMLMLDEPSAGLNDAETDNLAVLLESIRAEGVTVLLVDHKIDFIDRLCDRVVVLELGHVIAEGPPEDVWSDASVMDAYLGVADD
jgi:ABC-type branched-subunit amino acid transport system ATPase component